MQQIHTKGDNGNNYLTRIYGCKNNIKYDQQLYHRWCTADHSQINTTDHIKDLKLTCLIMCRTDNSNDKSQKNTKKYSKKSNDDGIFQTGQNELPAIVVQKVKLKLFNKTQNFHPFQNYRFRNPENIPGYPEPDHSLLNPATNICFSAYPFRIL